MSQFEDSARSWIQGDPDPEMASRLRSIIESGDQTTLEEIMGGQLEFGTAGIRGEVGPGPNRMNRAVVIRTTAGVARYLVEREGGVPSGPVVIGFDARPTSPGFAEDTAGVLLAAGFEVRYFEQFAPTPLVAFAAKHLDAVAAIVITASHNPPADNGYKVYDSNAAQIIPPTDAGIARAIEGVGPANEIPRLESPFDGGHERALAVGREILEAYWDEVDQSRPHKPSRTVRIVYTPLHGVGGETLLDIFGRSIHQDLIPVPEQEHPDGTFPTVRFPNPEEQGALDLALDLAAEVEADLVIGNDPDADRLAGALPRGDGWRLLTGNELGVLLGSYLLENWTADETPITANSIVSSPMLAKIADTYGALHLVTLTGFKWIANAALAVEEQGRGRFLFGYEEALGYTVGRTVRDKDGISASLLLADLAAIEAERGRTLLDRLADLWSQHGIWVSSQRSIVRPGESGQAEIVDAVARLAESAPEEVDGIEVTRLTDYREGADDRPPWLGAQDLIELELGEKGRMLVRPSGTEPKLKIYVDLRGTISQHAHEDRDRLIERAGDLAASMSKSIETAMG